MVQPSAPPVNGYQPPLSPENDPAVWPTVAAVVPAFNRREKTLRFCRNFREVDYPNKIVIITDDGSTDQTYHTVRFFHPEAHVLRGNGELWWSGGTNLAIRHALTLGVDYILTINDDVVMEPDFLKWMVRTALANERAIVGCRVHRQDEPEKLWGIGAKRVFRLREMFELCHSNRVWEEIADEVPETMPVDTMPGNGVLIPPDVFRDVGFYDEVNLPQYHADSDLVLRAAAAGYKPMMSTRSVLYNHIITVPLTNNKHDLFHSKKSDLYNVAVWTLMKRYAPFGLRHLNFYSIYAPFFLPPWAYNIVKRLIK